MPREPVRVPVTPEWLGEQDAKQLRYELRRGSWRALLDKPEE